MSNYFLIDRGIFEHPIFARQAYSKRDAWVWMIGQACFKEKSLFINGKRIPLNRGQLSFSLRFLAEKWGWDVSKVQRFFSVLKTDTMIATQSDTGQLVITICNYNIYQITKNEDDTPADTLIDTLSIQDRYRIDTKKNTVNTDNKESKTTDKQKKGSRFTLTELPDDWKDFCVTTRPELNPIDLFAEFRDYWISVPGSKGCKLDWFATWRNRVREKKAYQAGLPFKSFEQKAKDKTDLAIEEVKKRHGITS